MKRFINHSLRAWQRRREDELVVRDSNPCQQSESGATYLQEVGVPDPIAKSTSSLQDRITLHPAETPHQ